MSDQLRDAFQREVVNLTIPAISDYVRVARLAVSAVAARVGFDYDEVEDLRIVVDEVCRELVNDIPGASIEIACTVESGSLEIDFLGTSSPTRQFERAPEVTHEVSTEIVAALVDRVERTGEEGRVITKIAKRHSGR